jgi:hypothetical protein
MQFIRGNLAIRHHSELSKDLLLFEGQGDGWVDSWAAWLTQAIEIGKEPDRNGSLRSVIIFQWAPAELFQADQNPLSTSATSVPTSVSESLLGLELAALRVKALEDGSAEPSSTTDRIRRVWIRSQAVRL